MTSSHFRRVKLNDIEYFQICKPHVFVLFVLQIIHILHSFVVLIIILVYTKVKFIWVKKYKIKR